MRKDTTILVLCALFLFADGICFGETIDVRENLSSTFLMFALGGQILFAFIFVWLGWSFGAKIFLRQNRNIKRLSVLPTFPRPSRRFLSVWF
jgi:hypothetical protein